MRYFEKISFKQFKKDTELDQSFYKEYQTPARSTINSAGYDFKSIMDITIKPGEIKKIPTGIKANMNNDEALFIFVRSSMGFKYNIRLCNQVGIIDSDYYNNRSNEGHIYVALQNEGKENYVIKKGDAFCQGIFMKFLTVENEEEIKNIRNGGLGSTNKE